ncbi:hypothetical protein BGW41_007198 [Actinomortierella wolfii]|nr:hypothetical protein BGW41_007198 [Actinomortierella wolfii]
MSDRHHGSSQEGRSVPLPRPGELLIYDYRPQKSSSPSSATWSAGTVDLILGEELVATHQHHHEKTNASQSTSRGNAQKIRCLQWNIERNYKPKEILETLKAIDADVLCIQEIDIGCHRSGYDRDHFQEICETLQLVGGFVPEFWELEHSCRKDRDQGGGVHGNAILSKWPITGFRVLDHVHHAYEWEENGHKLNEPRLGRRFTIVAQIETPSGPMLAYCAHLEVFTGIVGRISALSDILADADLHKDQVPHQILFGDLNTISHSIARLAKTISTDQYRVLSLWQQESEWWDRNLWSWHVDDGEFNLALASGGFNWLRRFGILGLGTGAAGHDALHAASAASRASGSHGYWNSDIKYTAWLRRLVKDGLEKVQRARQMQLQSEQLIMHDHTQGFNNGCRPSQSSIQSPMSPSLHSLRHYHHYHPHHRHEGEAGSETEDFESEKSFQDDGSVVLVGRPRMQLKELESSAIDKEDKDSLASLSPTESFEGQVEDARETLVYKESDDVTQPVATSGEHFSPTSSPVRSNHRGRIGIITQQLDTMVGSASVPSTPLKSPTLRLIPPTPKGENHMSLHGVTDNDRGINLDYQDDHDEHRQPPPYQPDNGRDDGSISEGYTYYDDAEQHFERQRYFKNRHKRQSSRHYHQQQQHGYVADDDEEEMQATRVRRTKALARKFYDQDEDTRAASSRQHTTLSQQQQQTKHSHDNFNEYYPYHDRHPHDAYDPTHDSINDTTHSHDLHHHHQHSIRRRLIDDKISTSDQCHRTSEDQISPYGKMVEPRPPFSLLELEEPFLTHHRLWSGFTPLVLHQARNPGFYDPWDASKDLTLHNPNFLGLLSAKLDYTLLRNLECHARARGNEDYSASDHQWLVVTVSFEREFKLDKEIKGKKTKNQEVDSGNNSSSSGEDNEDEDEEEDHAGTELTQQEREYLWWRQKRMQWQQPVQPHHKYGLGHGSKSKSSAKNSTTSSSPISSWFKGALLVGAAAAAAAWWLKK